MEEEIKKTKRLLINQWFDRAAVEAGFDLEKDAKLLGIVRMDFEADRSDLEKVEKKILPKNETRLFKLVTDERVVIEVGTGRLLWIESKADGLHVVYDSKYRGVKIGLGNTENSFIIHHPDKL